MPAPSMMLLGAAGGGGAAWTPLDLTPTMWLRADDLALADGTAVSSWTDLSGNGLHATQGTGPNQPLLKTGIVNGHQVVRFDGSNDYLATSAPAISTKVGTMAVICKMTTTQNSSPLTNGAIASNGLSFLTSYSGTTKQIVRGGLAIDATATAADNNWDLLIIRSTADWYDFWSKGGAPIKSLTAPAAAVITPTTSTIVGSYTTSALRFKGDIAEVITKGSALSLADLNHIVDYAAARYGITTSAITQLTALGIIVYDGDSQMLAVPADGNTTIQKIMALTSGSHYEVGYAASGQTLVDIEADAASQYDALVDPVRNPVAVCWAGTNDMFFGASGTTAFNRYQAYSDSRRAAGWRVIAATALPRSDVGVDPDYETERQTFNTAVRNAGSALYDALYDVAADSRLGDAGDENDTTYYSTDLVHLKNAGRDIVAAGFDAALLSLGLA